MTDVFSVGIVSAVWCTSMFVRRERVFEPYRLRSLQTLQSRFFFWWILSGWVHIRDRFAGCFPVRRLGILGVGLYAHLWLFLRCNAFFRRRGLSSRVRGFSGHTDRQA